MTGTPEIQPGQMPHLLVTWAFDGPGVPPGPVLVVSDPRLYVYLRDLIMQDQQATKAEEATKSLLNALLSQQQGDIEVDMETAADINLEQVAEELDAKEVKDDLAEPKVSPFSYEDRMKGKGNLN